MPDITKCASDHCPRKEQCWRYVCEPSPFWQAYSNFDPENCERFIDAEKVNGQNWV